MDLSTVQCLNYQEPEDLHAIKLLNTSNVIVIVLTVAEMEWENRTEKPHHEVGFSLKFFSLDNDTTWMVWT